MLDPRPSGSGQDGRQKGHTHMNGRELLVLLPFAALAGASLNATLTSYRDVLPISQTRCFIRQGPNPVASIPFQVCLQARPWVEAIKQVAASPLNDAKAPPALENAL